MTRYFAHQVAGNIVLDEQFSHHLLNVLRAKIGDQVELVINSEVYLAQIKTLKPITFNIVEKVNQVLTNKPIHLIFCLLKGDKVDFVIQKAVELGVNSITLTSSTHTIIKWSPEDIEKKRRRLEKIIIEAAMQSKRTTIPKLIINLNFNQALHQDIPQKYIAYEQLVQQKIFDINLDKHQESVILIGPEGGFSELEYQFALQLGYHGVSLAQTILRAETASLVALAILNYCYE